MTTTETIGTMRALGAERGAIRVEELYDTHIDDLARGRGPRASRCARHGSATMAHGLASWSRSAALSRSIKDEPSAWRERWTELTPVYQAQQVG